MISVLIPTLHKTKWIRKNLEILRDDDRITEILIEKSKPRGRNRQKLLTKANNELLLWFDSDVELLNNPIDIFLPYLQREDVAGVSAREVPARKDLLSTLFYVNREVRRRVLPKVYDCRGEGVFGCGMFKKSVLMEVNGFNSGLHFAEDLDVYLKLRNKGYEVIGLRDCVMIHHQSWANPKKIKQYAINYNKVARRYDEYPRMEELFNYTISEKIRKVLEILKELNKTSYFPLYIVYFSYLEVIKRTSSLLSFGPQGLTKKGF